MTAGTWLAVFDESVAPSGLRNPQAVALTRFVDRYGGVAAVFVEARRHSELELVVLDIRTADNYYILYEEIYQLAAIVRLVEARITPVQ